MELNRRQRERQDISNYCTLSKPSGNWSFMCKITNLSECGMGVQIEKEVEILPEINSEVMVDIHDDETESVGKKAIVIWLIKSTTSSVDTTAGLEFI